MINFVKRNLFLVVIGAAAILFLVVFNNKSDQEKSVTVKPIQAASISTSTIKDEPDADKAYVDIKGEVKNPGVYKIPAGSRVEDVVSLAGGFTVKANQSVINLAQRVHDEMIILVPEAGEKGNTEAQESTDFKKVNLNYASQEDIEQLNGIGPSKAQAIIQYREEVGFFQTIEEVLNVPGIGEKTLENMKDSIQVP